MKFLLALDIGDYDRLPKKALHYVEVHGTYDPVGTVLITHLKAFECPNMVIIGL